MNRRTFLETMTGSISLGLLTAGLSCRKISITGLNESPRILLYSGWNTYNIGDQGHTPGTLRFLEENFKDISLTLWLHSTNDETITLLKNRYPWIQKIVRGHINRSGQCDNPELQTAFDQSDYLIQNSGMLYNSFWRAPSILDACIQKNKSFCLYGQSFDGFNDEDKDEMVRKLSKAHAIYCRDVESYYYLRKIGVKSEILEFGPDGCFGIDLLNEQKAIQYMNQAGLESKKFLTIIIRTNTSAGNKPQNLPDWDVGDTSQNPWDPTKKDQTQTELWIEKIREVIIQWVQKTDMKVFLAPEVTKEIKHAKELIYDQLPADIQSHVIHKAEWWNMDEASSMYKHSHSMLAMEPHSCIMALAHGTPAIHYFSERHGVKAYMFRDIGLPEWLYNIDYETSDKPFDALMDIYQDYNRAQSKVKRAIGFVQKRSSEMVENIESFLN